MIQAQAFFDILNLEAFASLGALIILAWIFYKVFLRELSNERHESLQGHIRRLFKQFLLFSCWFALFSVVKESADDQAWAHKSLIWVASITLLWGITVLVRVSRLLLLQYLFLGSMQAGVPLLIVNIFSLLMSLALVLWTAAHVFGLNLGPLLATSAAFSIILGLALQDTLGNLVAGISLQVDRSFEIGDWVEVCQTNLKIIGQVKEITWRSTLLIGWSDEVITIPNRNMASAQISNFTSSRHPIYRSLDFRLPYGSNFEQIKELILESIKTIPEICDLPSPICLLRETHESWVLARLSFALKEFGSQYRTADQILNEVLMALEKSGITLAHQMLDLKKPV